MFYLYLSHLTGYRKYICLFIRFLSSYLNEFLQSEIKEKLFSVQKVTCITVIADKKLICLFCASGVLCSPPQSAVQIKVSSAWLYFLLESITEEQKS